jgi:hypothetical protein
MNETPLNKNTLKKYIEQEIIKNEKTKKIIETGRTIPRLNMDNERLLELAKHFGVEISVKWSLTVNPYA